MQIQYKYQYNWNSPRLNYQAQWAKMFETGDTHAIDQGTPTKESRYNAY